MRELKLELNDYYNERNQNTIKEGYFWYLGTQFVIETDLQFEDDKWYFKQEFLDSKCGEKTWNDEINYMELCTVYENYDELDIIKGLLDKTISEEFAKGYVDFMEN